MIHISTYTIGPTHLSGTTATSVEHLFGQPSTLHPSWASTTSLPSTTPSFTSLATSPHPLPAQHLVPSTLPTPSSDSTTFHSVAPTFAAPTGPAFRQHGQLPLLQFMNRQYHLHHSHVHLPHLVFTNLNQWLPLHQHLPQLLLGRQQ